MIAVTEELLEVGPQQTVALRAQLDERIEVGGPSDTSTEVVRGEHLLAVQGVETHRFVAEPNTQLSNAIEVDDTVGEVMD